MKNPEPPPNRIIREPFPWLGLAIALLAVAAFILMGLALPADAADLNVNQASARTGVYGLEVTLTPCPAPDLVLHGVVTSDHQACETLQVSYAETSGPVALTSGQAILLGPEFAAGNGFSARIDPGLSQFASVTDRSPYRETHYVARFAFQRNTVSLGPNDWLEIFTGYTNGPQSAFRLFLTDGPDLWLGARRPNGTWEDTLSGAVLEDEWTVLEVEHQTGAGDGFVVLRQDGVEVAALGSLLNDGRVVDFVRLGAVAGLLLSGAPSEPGGSFYLDDFESFRD